MKLEELPLKIGHVPERFDVEEFRRVCFDRIAFTALRNTMDIIVFSWFLWMIWYSRVVLKCCFIRNIIHGINIEVWQFLRRAKAGRWIFHGSCSCDYRSDALDLLNTRCCPENGKIVLSWDGCGFCVSIPSQVKSLVIARVLTGDRALCCYLLRRQKTYFQGRYVKSILNLECNKFIVIINDFILNGTDPFNF